MKQFPHAAMSEEEGKLVLAVLRDFWRYRFGITNISLDMALELSRSSGQDGRARREFIEASQTIRAAVGADPQVAAPQRPGILKRLIG